MRQTHNIQKILIANRGEIAERIIKTCRRMGIKTVAVYSEVDEALEYVRMADEAYPLKGIHSNDTYMNQDRIIDIARMSQADAIHPGYGFLSENGTFVRKTEENGLVFIGPSAESIDAMGNKIKAKELAQEARVPLIPGTVSSIRSTEQALSEAEKIGYPVLLKAAAGGGGMGMRRADDPKELEEYFLRVKSEAKSFFGDETIFLEKFIENPKHIEIQIFGDQKGNLIHLYERDCSIQRRHQKVLEEAPCATILPETRTKMTEAALRLARQVNYYSSGTVEFLMDKNQNFYFLEMNTRLQVEHPVTEMITGTDLVEWQIRVADGQPLPCRQENIEPNGHAIELRLYAEEYLNDFAPSPGRIQKMNFPATPGIRLDMGFKTGDEVTLYYDPMIGKIICHGEDRQSCIHQLTNWLDEAVIYGVETTLPFGRFVLKDPVFISGNHTISYYDRLEAQQLEENEKSLGEIAALFAKHWWDTEKENRYLLDKYQK